LTLLTQLPVPARAVPVDSSVKAANDTVIVVRNVVDTVYLKPQSDYIAMLEKTNQQLSLWYNPYAVMIGVLAVLFTVLTIVAAFALWRQSKDYRDQIDGFIAEQQAIMDNMVAEGKRQTETTILELRGNLESASGEQRERTEALIARLQQHSARLPTPARGGWVSGRLREVANPVASSLTDMRIQTDAPHHGTAHRCIRCRKVWTQNEGADTSMVVCPHCHTNQGFNESIVVTV